MANLDELIQRVAETRKRMQEAADVEEVASNARRSAEGMHQEAYRELRAAVSDRVDELAPLREGDRLV